MPNARLALHLVLTSLLLLAAATGCVAAQPGGGSGDFRAASFVPRDAWAFTSLTLRPSLSQANLLRPLLEAFTSQPGWDTLAATLNDQASSSGTTPAGAVDFQRDILPLLDGEVAFAAYGAGSAFNPAALGLIHATEPDRLLAFLLAANGSTAPGSVLAEPGHRGATFYTSSSGRTLGATFRGWVLLADNRVAIEQAIDRIEAGGQGGLAETPRFRAAVDRLPAERLAYSYVDFAPLLQQIASDPAVVGTMEAETLRRAQVRTAASLAAAAGGVEIRVETLLDEPLPRPDAPSGDAVAAFGRLPGSTLVALSGDSLPRVLADAEQALEMARRSGDLPDDFPSPTELIAPWLAGEFAAGAGDDALRAFVGSIETVPEAAFVARVSDAAAAERALRQLDAAFPPKTVQSVVVAGQPLRQVMVAPGEALTYGVVDGWLYAMTGDPAEVLAARATGGLLASARFGLVRSALAPDGTNVFVDLQGIRELVEGSLGPQERASYDMLARPLVTPLRAFGAGTRELPNGDTSTRAFVAIRG